MCERILSVNRAGAGLRAMLVGAGVLMLSACGPKSGSDAVEHAHPRMRKAAELIQQQDVAGAMAIYEGLLRRDPGFATAHLQLGMAYQTLKDPVAAAYHFRKYLDQRPEGAKAEIVEQMLQSELIRLVDQHPAIRAMQPPDVLALQDEIAGLREQLQAAQMQLARRELEQGQPGGVRSAGVPTGVVEVPAVKPAPVAAPVRETAEPEPAAVRTYTVRSGDNLSVISQRMYGTPNRWREILEANRALLPSEKSLRPGQELRIP